MEYGPAVSASVRAGPLLALAAPRTIITQHVTRMATTIFLVGKNLPSGMIQSPFIFPDNLMTYSSARHRQSSLPASLLSHRRARRWVWQSEQPVPLYQAEYLCPVAPAIPVAD